MKKKRCGQSMIETLLAIAAMIIFVTATSGMTVMTEKSVTEMTMEMQAITIAEEGIQAVISISDRAWSAVTIGTYGLAINSGTPKMWVFSGSSDTADGFTRTVVVSSVDADTKKIVVTVTWHPQPNRTATIEEQILLTDWAFI